MQTLLLDPKLTDLERKKRRSEQDDAAAEWQATVRERLRLEEVLSKANGTETVMPRVGLRGTREQISSRLSMAHELLEVEEREAEAREAFREELGR